MSQRGWRGIDHGTGRARSHPRSDATLPEVIPMVTRRFDDASEWARYA
jgi:hypothetical protein